MRIFPLDTETSLHNVGETAVGKFAASPFHPDNWIVWLGIQELSISRGFPSITPVDRKKFPTQDDCAIGAPDPDDEPLLLVGHNIKYDLLMLCGPGNKYRDAWIRVILHPATRVWDTMQAEFRLLGQSKISPSMDWCAERRGMPTKPGRLKEYWENGISTEDIPDDEVDPYLEHDIVTTAELFRRQWVDCQEAGMLPLMRVEMNAVLATTVAEHNGMWFDKEEAKQYHDDVLKPKEDALETSIATRLAEKLGVPAHAVNPGSNPFMKAYLYGGVWKYKLNEPMWNEDGTPVLFKSGKKKGEHKKRWNTYEPELEAQCKKVYEDVGEDTLKKIVKAKEVDEFTMQILEDLIELRGIHKLAGTYFKGYSALCWPDGKIRTSLNHAIAATARLTSSSPNLQNAAHNEVRERFRSRYDSGRLMEVDLSQIEVVVQAVLSQDPDMMADVRNGVDFHCKRAALVSHETYENVVQWAKVEERPEWVKKRKDAKQFSFQRAYGAGPFTIAEATGLSVGEVKQFILTEEEAYPEIVTMQDRWIDEVKKSTGPRDDVICGSLRSVLGAEYRFMRELRRGEWTYKPTVIKNYPIQGLAGEVMKIILHKVRCFLYDYNDLFRAAQDQPVLMVNTVHDSVIFDVPSWVNAESLAGMLIHLFVTTDQDIKEIFGFDFNVPIRADAEIGEDWYKSMQSIK